MQKISYTWLTRRARSIQEFYKVGRRQALEEAWSDWKGWQAYPEHAGCDF